MNGVLQDLWQEVSKDLGFPTLEIHSNNPSRSQDWVAATWQVVVDPSLDGHFHTDRARARLAAQALVEVHDEVLRRLDPNLLWRRDEHRLDDLVDLPDLVIGYLAAEYQLEPAHPGHRERLALLEGIVHGETRRLVAEHGDLLAEQVPVVAGIGGSVAADDPRLGVDLLRRFR